MAVEWRELPIGDVATVIGGGTPSTKDEGNFNGSIPWLTPKDLSGYPYRYISRGKRNISEKGLTSSSARLLPKGAVLLTTRAPVGYVAIASNSVTTNQGFRSLVLQEGFHPEFVYYLLKSKIDLLKAHASGTTFGELSGTTLKGLRFLFPPLPEQRAIAAILGALDDKIELNRQMNQTLEAMAQALFKSWFVDFEPFNDQDMQESVLGPIPREWRCATVSEAIEINPSRRVEQGANTIYVDMASLPTTSARVLTVIRRAFTGSGSRFRNGDILLGRITPCLENGKTAIVDFLEDGENGWGSTEFIVLGPRLPLSTPFIYCLARNPDFRAHAIQAMTGTSGRQRVDTGCFSYYWLAIPPKSVAEQFDHKVEPWFQMMKANDDESHVLATIRDALLPKLVSGKIRVKDAEKFVENAV